MTQPEVNLGGFDIAGDVKAAKIDSAPLHAAHRAAAGDDRAGDIGAGDRLGAVLSEVRAVLLDPDALVRAVGAGKRRGQPQPSRVELRPVDLKAGRQLQIVTSDGVRPVTTNVPYDRAASTVDRLLAVPYGNWHVESTAATIQVRVTKKGDPLVHRGAPVSGVDTAHDTTHDRARDRAHDRAKAHLLAPDDPLYETVGGSAAKRRQVDAFLRSLRSTLDGELPSPLRVVDLGCGNAYLTFAAHRYLTAHGVDATVTGVDVREDQRARNTAIAERLGCAERVRFVAATIEESEVDSPPHVVLALHACDTATDEALARAVRWRTRWILAAPCCHHHVAAQLRSGDSPPAYKSLVRQGILRERFADVLTDGLRSLILRLAGYRVDVVEFVDSQHTPRNLMLRATWTGAQPTDELRAEYRELRDTWGVRPKLEELLGSAL